MRAARLIGSIARMDYSDRRAVALEQPDAINWTSADVQLEPLSTLFRALAAMLHPPHKRTLAGLSLMTQMGHWTKPLAR